MTNEPDSRLDPLAPRLEEALLLSGMSQTKFGYVHFGDPAFMLKLRRGRKFRPHVAAKVEQVIAEIGA